MLKHRITWLFSTGCPLSLVRPSPSSASSQPPASPPNLPCTNQSSSSWLLSLSYYQTNTMWPFSVVVLGFTVECLYILASSLHPHNSRRRPVWVVYLTGSWALDAVARLLSHSTRIIWGAATREKLLSPREASERKLLWLSYLPTLFLGSSNALLWEMKDSFDWRWCQLCSV